jgi:hypothetical protein
MRTYALEKLLESGAAEAVRRRHAEVLHAYLAERHPEIARHAECLPELDNVREAIAWAQANVLPLAVDLTSYTVRITTFTPWRAQSHAWMTALEPQMDGPQAAAVPAAARVNWWNEFARASISGLCSRCNEIARKATALARIHGDPLLLFHATAALVRSRQDASRELDSACTDLVALMNAFPEWPARTRLIGKGALAVAASRRADYEALLSARHEEMALAKQAGLTQSADAAETNIAMALRALHRYEEALVHARAVVTRLQGVNSLNLAWGWESVLASLVQLGRHDEARAAMPEAVAACQAFELPICSWIIAELAFQRGRVEAAARLIGYARNAFEARGMGAGALDAQLQGVVDLIAPHLDASQMQALAQEGRALTDAQALELSCGE